MYEDNAAVYLAAADISTAEFLWTEFKGQHRIADLCDQLFKLLPVELVLAGKISGLEEIQNFITNRIPRCIYTTLVPDDFSVIDPLPQRHFSPEELPATSGASTAVACLLFYLYQTVKSDLSHLNHLSKLDARELSGPGCRNPAQP